MASTSLSIAVYDADADSSGLLKEEDMMGHEEDKNLDSNAITNSDRHTASA